MSDREALQSVAVIRDAFNSVRDQFRDEQYVIDSIIAGLNIAIHTLDRTRDIEPDDADE